MAVDMIGIEEHLPLVAHAVAKYSRRGVPSHLCDDLRSAGTIGLMDAQRRFDVASGVPFACYARLRIHGEMADELRRMDWMSRHSRERAKLAGTSPRSPFVSIDFRPFEDGETIGERMEDDSIRLAREQDEKREAITALVQKLPERERTVVTLYFFGEMNLPAIGRQLGVSMQRVHQILGKAIRRLREWLTQGPDALAA